MFKSFYPDEFIDSTYKIDYRKMYDLGYRGIIYDIDNTLVPHGAGATEEATGLINRLRRMGFQCILVSNNHEDRVQEFNRELKLPYVYEALKPSSGGYLKASELMGLPPDQIFCIGDQIFTDVWGARRAGMYMILVEPINAPEPLFVRFKRVLEKPILWAYRKNIWS